MLTVPRRMVAESGKQAVASLILPTDTLNSIHQDTPAEAKPATL